MATYLPSATYRKIIADKYGREPIEYAAQGGQQYEDLEFVRSKAHEESKMFYTGSTTKEQQQLRGTRASRTTQRANGDN